MCIRDRDKVINELALEIFEKGYDTRFQTAQAIPVFLNEDVYKRQVSYCTDGVIARRRTEIHTT